MQIEQALFTSATTRQARGYHLVARSAGIDGDLAQTLSLWCPSQGALIGSGLGFSSLNYFPAGDGWMALTRTVYGGPEYSDRGGLQVMTMILALRREQMAGYEFDPVALAQTALALGHLRLRPAAAESLPPLELPDESLIGDALSGSGGFVGREPIDGALAILTSGGRVAFTGVSEPLPLLDTLVAEMLPEQRTELSFTTGLRPSMHRPFRIQCLPAADEAVQRQLESQDIVCVDASAPRAAR